MTADHRPPYPHAVPRQEDNGDGAREPRDVMGLLVNIANSVMNLEHGQGRILGELGTISKRVGALEVQRGAAPHRDPESSIHEYDPALATLRQTLRTRASDPADPLNDHSAKALVAGIQAAVAERRELAVWRSIKRGGGWALSKALEHAITLLVGGGVVLIWHWLTMRGR